VIAAAAAALRWLAFGVVIGVLGWVVPRLRLAAGGAGTSLAWHARTAARLALATLGVRVTTAGLDALDPGDASLFLVNHVSFIDPLVLIAHLPVPVRIMTSAKYFRVPVLGAALRLHGHYPVEAGNLANCRDLMAWARADLARGRSIVVFPEATRSTSGRLLPFRRGAFDLAVSTRTRVVPIYVYGTHALLPKDRPLLALRPGRVHVMAGKPMAIDPRDATTAGVAELRAAYEREYASHAPA
jgi:1-acyl-sn-glycerol-3-phosphate acyltransferase